MAMTMTTLTETEAQQRSTVHVNIPTRSLPWLVAGDLLPRQLTRPTCEGDASSVSEQLYVFALLYIRNHKNGAGVPSIPAHAVFGTVLLRLIAIDNLLDIRSPKNPAIRHGRMGAPTLSGMQHEHTLKLSRGSDKLTRMEK